MQCDAYIHRPAQRAEKKKTYAYALAKIRTCEPRFITLKEGFQLDSYIINMVENPPLIQLFYYKTTYFNINLLHVSTKSGHHQAYKHTQKKASCVSLWIYCHGLRCHLHSHIKLLLVPLKIYFTVA